jgi:hypothetical protein
MTKEQQYNYMVEQLTKIATTEKPQIYGALLQLIAKQTLEEIAIASQSN